MLDSIQISILAIIQGLTEFLPISSSAHLLLPSILLGWRDQGLAFDVAVHVGSLLAVLLYFREDILKLLFAWISSLRGNGMTAEGKLAWMLIAATIPAGLAGLFLNDLIETYARSALVIGTTSIVFGFLLYLADRTAPTQAVAMQDLKWSRVMFIGFAQALALIPGTSRSGITMTAGLFCQLDRREASRFSFLLAIPIIAASGLLEGIDLLEAGVATVSWGMLIYGALLSGIVAFSCIHLFLKLIQQTGFLPFVVYRVALGLVLLAVYWWR